MGGYSCEFVKKTIEASLSNTNISPDYSIAKSLQAIAMMKYNEQFFKG